MCTQGEGPREGQVWKKKADHWPEERKRPRRTDVYKWSNCLFTVLSSLRGHPHIFSLGVHLFLASISTKQFLLLLFRLSSSPTCCCAMSLLINFVCAFTVSAASINAFFSEGKDSGKNNF